MRILLADDEPLARRRLRRLLRDEESVEIVGECGSGRETIEALQAQTPDLVFLDVQMPELDGFDVLAAVGPERMPPVVFVTAYDQYAVRAFEVNALDYLLKPFDADRFRKAFRRAKEQLELRSTTQQSDRLQTLLDHLASGAAATPTTEAPAAPARERQVSRLLIKSGGRVFFVRVAEIDWIEASGNYLRLHVGRETHLLRATMGALAERLDPAQFLRVHRSTIVNLDCIREMQPWFSGEYVIILRDGTKLKLSRTYRDELAEKLGQSF